MYPGLVSCPFYAIPIYPFKFMKFFIYLYIYSLINAEDAIDEEIEEAVVEEAPVGVHEGNT